MIAKRIAVIVVSVAVVALVLGTSWQGIAGRVLKHLTAIARRQGLARFTAEVLPGNRALLAVFSRSGLPLRREAGDGVEHVTLALGE
jgi:RimJ/RimL family protein N-acetyltransferase